MTKKDLLELKRRMKKDDCTFTKLRGCYVDNHKNIVLRINETFLNLEEEEQFKYLEIAKKALSGTIGNQLLELSFSQDESGTELQTFFLALRNDALKSDGLAERLYERIIETYEHTGNYLILLFHDAYDVIVKTTDRTALDESEEVYEYILCAICPVDLTKAGLGYHEEKNCIAPRIRDWVVSVPETGFLFPAFSERSSDVNAVGYYVKDAKKAQPAFMETVLGCAPKRTATEEKTVFQTIVKEVLSKETDDPETLLLDIQQEIRDFVDEHKTIYQEEPLFLDSPTLQGVLTDKGLSENAISLVEEVCQETFGDTPPLAEHLFDPKALTVHTEAKKTAALQQELAFLKEQVELSKETPLPENEIRLQIASQKIPLVQTETIHGKKCIVIPIEEEEHLIINGNPAEQTH